MKTHRHTRRRWLASCAGATAGLAALAGCADETDTSSPDDDPGATASGGNYGDWPMERYNAANRLSVPHNGLDGEPEVLWTAELSGATRPPVVYDDTVFVNHGYDTCTAISIDDGETLWEVETAGSEAIAVSDVALFAGGDGLEAFDRDDGDVLWSSGHNRTVTSIRLYDDTIYAGLEDFVVAFDENGRELLEFETPEPVQSLAIDDDHIYARCRKDPDVDEFVILGYDRDDGDQLWEHDISHAQQWADDRVTRTLPVVNETLYITTDDHLLSIAGSNGDVTEVTEFDSVAWTRPSIHDGTAYLERGSMAYDINNDETPSDWDPEFSSETPLVIAGETGYGVASNATDPLDLVAADPDTGERRWAAETPQQDGLYYPVVLSGVVILAMDDFGLIAFG